MNDVILDKARENGIEDKDGVVDFRQYNKFLNALMKSYTRCKDYDEEEIIKVQLDLFAETLESILELALDKSNKVKKIKFSDLVKNDYAKWISEDFARYFIKKIRTTDEKEYQIFKQKIMELNSASKRVQMSIKRLYVEQIFKVNNLRNDALEGNVLLRTVEGLKRKHINQSSRYTISTRIVNTSDGNKYWYLNQHRQVALLYDFNWENLVCMCTSDFSTDNGYEINFNRAIQLSVIQEKVLIGDFLPLEIALRANTVGAYPAISLECLTSENEIIFTTENQSIGIVITEDYLNHIKSQNDYAGVKNYSKYADIPIYVVRDGKYCLVSDREICYV